MRETDVFYEALKGTEPPPCESYKCNNFKLCATEKLACKSFHLYTFGGRSPNPYSPQNVGPNKAIYNKIFFETEGEDE